MEVVIDKSLNHDDEQPSVSNPVRDSLWPNFPMKTIQRFLCAEPTMGVNSLRCIRQIARTVITIITLNVEIMISKFVCFSAFNRHEIAFYQRPF